ncbi:MAG: outer membrane beta-barrel protein [Rickettsiales bacterium]
MRTTMLLVLLLFSFSIYAETEPFPGYVQILLGQLDLDEDNVTIDRGDLNLEGSVDSLPYVGGAVQMPWKDDFIGFGWEGGGFVSWENDDVSYYAYSGPNGGKARISIDNGFWSLETFIGAYASLKPIDRLRFYAGAGPLFMFARADSEDFDEDVEIDGSTETISGDGNSDSDFALGWYARVGADIRLGKHTWLGASVRQMQVDVDLSDALGEFDINGQVYQLTITQRY